MNSLKQLKKLLLQHVIRQKRLTMLAKDMKERGVIRETISAAEEVNIAARETAQTVRETVSKKPPAEVQSTGVSEKTTARTRTKENPPL